MEEMKVRKESMEEGIKEWANYKFELENKEKWDIVFNELENNNTASDTLVGLINDLEEKFFKLDNELVKGHIKINDIISSSLALNCYEVMDNIVRDKEDLVNILW